MVISDTTPGRYLAQLVKVFWYCENDECHQESFLGRIRGERKEEEREKQRKRDALLGLQHGESRISAARDGQTTSICSGPPGSEHSRNEKFLDQLSRNWETPGYCTHGGFLLPRHLLGNKCS